MEFTRHGLSLAWQLCSHLGSCSPSLHPSSDLLHWDRECAFLCGGTSTFGELLQDTVIILIMNYNAWESPTPLTGKKGSTGNMYVGTACSVVEQIERVCLERVSVWHCWHTGHI